MFNYNHLYYFYVTAKSGNTSAAAEHLQISQPALSSQLKILESSLSTKLFRRVGRRNQLTEAGSVIYGLCRRMFDISEELSELILERMPSSTRRITVGVSEEIERSLVGKVVSLFLKRQKPGARPRVTAVSGSHAELIDRVRFRELDALVTPLPLHDPELASLERFETPVTLVCATSRGARVTPQRLLESKESQWVMPPVGFKLRFEIDRFFESHGLKGRVALESDVIESLVHSVSDGIGIALMPKLYLTRARRDKSVQALGPKQGYWKHSIWLGCHRQNQDDPLILALARSFKEVCAGAHRLR